MVTPGSNRRGPIQTGDSSVKEGAERHADHLRGSRSESEGSCHSPAGPRPIGRYLHSGSCIPQSDPRGPPNSRRTRRSARKVVSNNARSGEVRMPYWCPMIPSTLGKRASSAPPQDFGFSSDVRIAGADGVAERLRNRNGPEETIPAKATPAATVPIDGSMTVGLPSRSATFRIIAGVFDQEFRESRMLPFKTRRKAQPASLVGP